MILTLQDVAYFYPTLLSRMYQAKKSVEFQAHSHLEHTTKLFPHIRIEA